jgi:hypothetical protein
MSGFGFVQGFPCLLLLVFCSWNARGDGGVIRLREAQGPFVVTIFTPSDPVRNAPVEVSVMVQERDSSDPILDAKVDLVFTAPSDSILQPTEEMCGPPEEAHSGHLVISATRKQASNKLLYAAQVRFDAVGHWQLQARVERGGDVAKMACAIPVGPPRNALMGLWPYLLLPPVMLGLFALNHYVTTTTARRRRE